ncbi:hypothetical protein Anapl_11679 [Anas platyrhynchos]|uniref:Uncharacterized protein n=1 Tax=Anas platyrhynchos TaxID=8839 RepID=R0JLF8_ANAPL|nr:hypothetical protein Anapl_11679 [Anas platyrhynchos]
MTETDDSMGEVLITIIITLDLPYLQRLKVNFCKGERRDKLSFLSRSKAVIAVMDDSPTAATDTVITGKGMLPRQDMNRHLFTKEEEGEEERKGGKDRLTVEMDYKYLDSRKGDVCEKDFLVGADCILHPKTNMGEGSHPSYAQQRPKNNKPENRETKTDAIPLVDNFRQPLPKLMKDMDDGASPCSLLFSAVANKPNFCKRTRSRFKTQFHKQSVKAEVESAQCSALLFIKESGCWEYKLQAGFGGEDEQGEDQENLSDDTEPVFLTVDACSAIFLQGTDSSHITEMLGRKRCALWLNSHGGQVSRKERERCLLVIDVSNSTSNPAAKPCDNRDNPVLSAGRCQRQGPRVNCAHFVYNREWRQAEAKACFTHTASQDKQTLNCV